VPDKLAVAPSDDLSPRMLQETASMFALLSATVRLHILWLLASGDSDVGSLANQTGQSLATVSHHLAKLKLAGLVDVHRSGKRHIYTATDPHVLLVIRQALGARLDEFRPYRRARNA
jgi:DNA-binding transcriptional ArsR family regulator